jgi:hypothetical protein
VVGCLFGVGLELFVVLGCVCLSVVGGLMAVFCFGLATYICRESRDFTKE